MRFNLPADAGSFEIPDDWWRFAEMERFQPSPGGYYPYRARPENDVDVVPIADIEPPRRSPGTPMLKKFKMMPVLFAFQSPECALSGRRIYALACPRLRASQPLTTAAAGRPAEKRSPRWQTNSNVSMQPSTAS